MSTGAKIMWGVIAAPFVLLGISLLVWVLTLLLALVATPAVYLAWNVGLVNAAPLVGLAVSAVTWSKAFAVALTLSLLRSAFGSTPSYNSNKRD